MQGEGELGESCLCSKMYSWACRWSRENVFEPSNIFVTVTGKDISGNSGEARLECCLEFGAVLGEELFAVVSSSEDFAGAENAVRVDCSDVSNLVEELVLDSGASDLSVKFESDLTE